MSELTQRLARKILNQMGENGKPTVRLDYRMSRSELLFERTPPAGYHAAYEVRVIFLRDKGERQVTGDTYTRELHAQTYAETHLRWTAIVRLSLFGKGERREVRGFPGRRHRATKPSP